MRTLARPALLLLLGALSSHAGQVRYTEIPLEEVVRDAAWIVEAVPAKPATTALVARDPRTGWKTPYTAERFVVHRILKAPDGERIGVPGTIAVVSDDLNDLEELGERAAGKGFISPRLPDAEGACPQAGARLLFLFRPNARAEFPNAYDACLPVSARGKVEGILKRQGGSLPPGGVAVPRLPTRPLKGLKKR